MASITINGASHQTEPGERLVDAINRTGTENSSGLLSPSVRADSDLRHLHRGSEW